MKNEKEKVYQEDTPRKVSFDAKECLKDEKIIFLDTAKEYTQDEKVKYGESLARQAGFDTSGKSEVYKVAFFDSMVEYAKDKKEMEKRMETARANPVKVEVVDEVDEVINRSTDQARLEYLKGLKGERQALQDEAERKFYSRFGTSAHAENVNVSAAKKQFDESFKTGNR